MSNTAAPAQTIVNPGEQTAGNRLGVTAPHEKPNTEEGGQHGYFYENLPDNLQASLRELKDQYRMEQVTARIAEIKRIRQAREFWKGVQNIWWNEAEGAWRLPTYSNYENGVDEEQMPRFDFVTNLFQAFGLSIISVLSQDIPATFFMPQSAQQLEDKATAKAANEIAEVIQRNNKAQKLLEEIAFYMWTDGKIASYTRYVVDASRFGYEDFPEYQQGDVDLAPSGVCPVCGTPQPTVSSSGECPECGFPQSEFAGFGAEEMQSQIPQVTGHVRIPNGQEIIDIFGGLEVQTPMWANKQPDFPYLFLHTEQHISRLRSAYPHARDKIGANPDGGPQAAGDEYERQVRIQTQMGGDGYGETGTPSVNLVTFERCWFRPYAFEMLEKAEREELLKLFPDGCYAAFAGDAYCEARPEKMDDHWVVRHALPGNGQNRNAIGTSFISINERFNTLSNLTMENVEYTIPTTYADSKVVDFEALDEQTAEPGTLQPAKGRPGVPLSQSFFESKPGRLAPETYTHMMDLMGDIGQFVAGAFPALWGGSMQNVKTAAGYAMARDQAMGRMGVPYRALKELWNQTELLAVEQFRKHRLDDVEVPLKGNSGEFESKWIRTADLRGNLYVEIETDEQFPRLWTQTRNMVIDLMGTNEAFAMIMQSPKNMEFFKRVTGLDEMEIPGENSRNKQRLEINQLLREPYIKDPSTVPATILPSMPIDKYVDDHEQEAMAGKEWLNSPEGVQAKEDNPEGWINVRAHVMLHELVLIERAAVAMQQPEELQPEQPQEGAEEPHDGSNNPGSPETG